LTSVRAFLFHFKVHKKKRDEKPVLSEVEGPVLSTVEGPVLSAVEGSPFFGTDY
jgi:hypothetical protein